MFKQITFAVLMIAFTSTLFGQNPEPRLKNEIAIEFEAVRQKIEIRVPNSNDFVFNPNTDAVGFRIEYVRKVTPLLGIGMKTGVNFGGENREGQVFSCGTGCTRTIVGESKIALAHFSYLMRLQSSKNTKRFRPYVEGAVGVSREHFDGITFAGNRLITAAGNSYTYGFGAGFDIKLNRNLAWRTGADYLNTKGLEGRRHNALLHTGLVVRFESK